MKRMNKIILFSVIIMLIIFANANTTKSIFGLNIPIDTGITHLSWTETEFHDPGEGYSYFNFTIDYYIHNPSLKTETITLPYSALGFMANMTVDFVDENLAVYYYHFIAACVLGYIDVEPGITFEVVRYMLAINETGLTILPDGIYTIWIFCYGVLDVTFNETIMTMDNGAANVTFGDIPSVTIGFQFPIVVLLGSIIISTLIVVRKRRK